MSQSMAFGKASKQQLKLRLGISGPSGSGKTYSALAIASGLGKRIAVIDTEHGSASLYADRFDFDRLNLETFSPETYVAAINLAEREGYEVIVVDSLTHAWSGKDGALEQVDIAAKKNKGNSYIAWRDVTPMHNRLVDSLVSCKAHLIGTMRSKTEYILETDSRGKQVPRKVGMAPIQREGMEYEFTLFGDMDLENNFVVTKTRCSELAGKLIAKPGADLAKTLKAWLESGEAMVLPAPTEKTEDPSAKKWIDWTATQLAKKTTAEDLVSTHKTVFGAKLPDELRKRLLADIEKRQAELTAPPVEAPPADLPPAA